MSKKDKLLILNRDGYSCVFCGFSTGEDTILEIAHIRSVEDHGTDEESNLLSLCPNCHRLMDRLNLICISPENCSVLVREGSHLHEDYFSQCRSEHVAKHIQMGNIMHRFRIWIEE